MDSVTAAIIFPIALWLLVVTVGLLVMYGIIRAAVTSALKAHTRWVDEGKP